MTHKFLNEIFCVEIEEQILNFRYYSVRGDAVLEGACLLGCDALLLVTGHRHAENRISLFCAASLKENICSSVALRSTVQCLFL
jgi:hypothetical protein